MKTIVVLNDWTNNLLIPKYIPACKMEVPDTFKELQELCKKYKIKHFIDEFRNGIKFIDIHGISFCEDGEICDRNDEYIVKKRTFRQMWWIIISLTEEVKK